MNLKHLVAQLMRRTPGLYALTYRLVQAFTARTTIGVTGAIFNQKGEVLLLEHVFRNRRPWGLGGGWVGRRESPQDALRRELMEEVGLAVDVGPPLLVELSDDSGYLETSFLCAAEGEVSHLSGEILSARWVSPTALPDDLKSFDRRVIRQAQALHGRWLEGRPQG